MEREALDATIKQGLREGHWELLIIPAALIAVAVLFFLIRLYVKEWREKREGPYWARKRRQLTGKKQD